MTEPFIVLALPRSRTFWLANFLHSPEVPCGHDTLVGCASTDEFFDLFARGLKGTVETAGMLGAELIRWRLPQAKLVVLRRSLGGVMDSLDAAGFDYNVDDLVSRAAMLDEISSWPGVETVQYAQLSDRRVAEWLYTHCTGAPPSFGHFQHLAEQNLQIDLEERKKYLVEHRVQHEQLKQDMRERLADMKGTSGVVIRQESYLTMGLEAEALGAIHFAEVNADLMPQRKYRLRHDLLGQMYLQGSFKTFTLRRAGKLQGYITWQLFLDPEAGGVLSANQGAWFVLPKAKGQGLKLFEYSLDALRKLGVQVANPHHRLLGRGGDLGKYFTRIGAIRTEQVYSLWIGENSDG